MFRWETVGSSDIALDAAPLPQALDAPLQTLLDACTVPIAIHDFARAAVLGCGTLMQHGPRVGIATAAHLFDAPGLCVGNLLVTAHQPGTHSALIDLAGARVLQDADEDVAWIDLTHAVHLGSILHGRALVDAADCAAPENIEHTAPCPHVLSGYPAQWSRFARGWLAARRLTVRTQPRDAQRHLFEFATHAQDAQGRTIHTPAMEGMSGAGVWRVLHTGQHANVWLVGVQSAFMHSRYLRAAPVAALNGLLNRLQQ
jgi:hypothetical protein